MSRIGRLPIEIPAGVTVTLADNVVTVKGPLGTLTRALHPAMKIAIEGNHVVVSRPNDTKENKALHGLTRVLINNMVLGVTKGFEKTLVVNGVGYKVAVEGTKVVFNVGFSHPVPVEIPQGIKAKAENGLELTVSGIDKELVGQFAANLRDIKRPDPYHIYGIRYKDEVIVKKVGKTAGK
ncbi:MAG: 50S ribosomal protein L6 [Clostridia bacterium]|nr:50S ribosomal protein L6 [Clostridia bacterium]